MDVISFMLQTPLYGAAEQGHICSGDAFEGRS